MKKFLFGISRIIFAVSCLTLLSFQQANAQDKNPLLGKKVLVFRLLKDIVMAPSDPVKRL